MNCLIFLFIQKSTLHPNVLVFFFLYIKGCNGYGIIAAFFSNKVFANFVWCLVAYRWARVSRRFQRTNATRKQWTSGMPRLGVVGDWGGVGDVLGVVQENDGVVNVGDRWVLKAQNACRTASRRHFQTESYVEINHPCVFSHWRQTFTCRIIEHANVQTY